jgi:hypothetical protein
MMINRFKIMKMKHLSKLIAAMLSFCLLFLIVFKSNAAQYTIDIQGPGTVSVGQPFQVTFVMNERPSNFQLPNSDVFTLVGGPSVMQSENEFNNNGRVTRSSSVSYTYAFVINKEGTFSLPPVVATINGKSVSSQKYTVQVVAGSSRSGGNSRQQVNSRSQSDGNSNSSSPDMFVTLSVNKSSVYLGEQLVATVKIYSRVNIVANEGFKTPNFDGFYRQDVKVPQVDHLEREVVNGVVYGSAVIAQMVLSPQKTGDLVIDPVDLQMVVQKVVRSRQPRDIWDEFFDMGPSVENVRQKVSSKPVKIKVKPLPEPKPASFNGATGNFSLKVNPVGEQQGKTNEAISLKLTLTGTGNLKLIDAPKLQFPEEFEVYDPKLTENYDESAPLKAGSKTWEYIIIPRKTGTYTIPSAEISFFNPQTGKYNTLKTPELTYQIAQGDETTDAQVFDPSHDQVKVLSKDIRYIKTSDYKLYTKGYLFAGSPLFWILLILPLILLVTIWFIWRQRIRELADVMLTRRKRANKLATMKLKKAYSAFKKNDKSLFYEEIHGAWVGYLGDKLSIPTAILTRDLAKERLLERGVSEDVIASLSDILDNCEMARFAPSAVSPDLSEVYQQSVKLINNIEAVLKNNKSI